MKLHVGAWAFALRSVITFSGQLQADCDSCGHYKAWVYDEAKWFEYNDAIVRVHESQPLALRTESRVLFYERVRDTPVPAANAGGHRLEGTEAEATHERESMLQGGLFSTTRSAGCSSHRVMSPVQQDRHAAEAPDRHAMSATSIAGHSIPPQTQARAIGDRPASVACAPSQSARGLSDVHMASSDSEKDSACSSIGPSYPHEQIPLPQKSADSDNASVPM